MRPRGVRPGDCKTRLQFVYCRLVLRYCRDRKIPSEARQYLPLRDEVALIDRDLGHGQAADLRADRYLAPGDDVSGGGNAPGDLRFLDRRGDDRHCRGGVLPMGSGMEKQEGRDGSDPHAPAFGNGDHSAPSSALFCQPDVLFLASAVGWQISG